MKLKKFDNKFEKILRYLFVIGFYIVTVSQLGRFELTIFEKQGILFAVIICLYQILKLNKRKE